MYKIATWNVNSVRARLDHILRWLDSAKPQVLALQETKVCDDDFPVEAFAHTGYHLSFSGQKSYNGMAVLSQAKATDPVSDFPKYTDPQRRLLAVTVDDIRIINVYVPNGQSLDSDKYDYKLQWLENLYHYIQAESSRYQRLLILGDFNIAPGDRDVYDPVLWRDRILVSDRERAAFQKLLKLDLHDSFYLFPQADSSYTWWDYRQAAFLRNHGLRIDHILINSNLRSLCTASSIDTSPRTWERPSDHTILLTEFDL